MARVPMHVVAGTAQTQLKLQHLVRVLNGQVSFGDPNDNQTKPNSRNMDGVWYVGPTDLANVEFTVTHNLGRIPVGYLVVGKSSAATIYDSRRDQWTTTQMFLKANAHLTQLWLFIL